MTEGNNSSAGSGPVAYRWKWKDQSDDYWRHSATAPSEDVAVKEPLYATVPQALPVIPKAMHWLGDRENADETRHAVDTTGCVLYFDSQGDCLEFMNSVLSALPRPQPQS